MDKVYEKMQKLRIEFEKIIIKDGKNYLKNKHLFDYIYKTFIDYIEDKKELLERIKEKPKIASGCPYRIHLEKNKDYFYCTCGLSKLQVRKF
jgi:hypothetical protein